MATETTQAAPPTHDAEPIVRDRLYIGGEWVEPTGDGVIEVIDSTTEQVMGTVPEGTPADVDRAVAAARTAFELWSQVPVHERAAACAGIGMQLAARGEEIAALVSREVGMPIELSAQIQAGLPTMDFMSMPDVAEQIELGGAGRQLADRPRAGGRRRLHHAVELPAAPAQREGGAGARWRAARWSRSRAR